MTKIPMLLFSLSLCSTGCCSLQRECQSDTELPNDRRWLLMGQRRNSALFLLIRVCRSQLGEKSLFDAMRRPCCATLLTPPYMFLQYTFPLLICQEWALVEAERRNPGLAIINYRLASRCSNQCSYHSGRRRDEVSGDGCLLRHGHELGCRIASPFPPWQSQAML
ncbi:hypothetical protein V8C35DRAFT_289825 [Trichoderma chlorosporum]